jgi:hypothetical protein
LDIGNYSEDIKNGAKLAGSTLGENGAEYAFCKMTPNKLLGQKKKVFLKQMKWWILF